MHKFIIIAVSFSCLFYERCFSQTFDSVHVYAVYMNGSYYVKIDKDLIKNEVGPIIVTDKEKVNMINKLLKDTVKGKKLKKIKSNYLDIRLFFEFFRNNEVIQIIGFTPHNRMFVDHMLYIYDRRSLNYIDKYIAGLSRTLGIK